jgi:acetoin utilization protein AcuC
LHHTSLVWNDALASYRFHAEHPLNPRRLELTLGLIMRLGLAGDEARPVVAPRDATEDEVLTVHAPEYIDAVKRAATGQLSTEKLARYGLGTEDVPVVDGMHEASLHIAGATLTAADEVLSGRARRAFNPSGGLHHARRAEAAGFCVYNDLALATRWLQRQHGARVMIIDVDAHHGDGTQWILYDDPGVLKVSFHESGAYLFPGTGFVDEMGNGNGYGYTVNVPLDAHTEDDSFIAAFDALVPELAQAFRPDVILMQCGCDSHVLDPLTHLRCTTRMIEHAVATTCAIADDVCGGRLVATGGGGYAIYAVVPRAWTLVWAGLCGVQVADALPEDWLRALRLESGSEVPTLLRDPEGAFAPSPRRSVATQANARTVEAVRRQVLPVLTGWGLAF